MMEMLFSGGAAWFSVPAIVGTVFFALRLLFMMVGLDHGHDLHLEVDHGDIHTDPGDAFKLLSVQSIGAFLMGFGWGGWGALRGTDWGWPAATGCAVVCGIGMVWLLALLLKALMELQSSGNLALDSTIGAEGHVYAEVPARGAGRGQVKLVLNDRMRIVNAVSDSSTIASNARVRVTMVNDDNTVTVSPA